MRNAAFFSVAFLAATATAKPWNGIDPGTSKKEQVIARFGEPSQVIPSEGKETLAYLGPKAIKGTTQAQFRVDTTTQVVERIDVFPGPVIDRQLVEESYGPACPASGPAPKEPCYVKKVNDSNFKTYFIYMKLGLAVFFKEDNKTVSSLVFTPLAAAPKAKPQAAAGAGAGTKER
jgi:hypothetical protein